MTNARKTRSMTPAEFEAVRPLLGISQDRIDAAYSALVLGKVFQVIALEYGWSRQAVSEAVKNVWSTLQAYRAAQQAEKDAINKDLPDGWMMLSIAAPMDLIDPFVKKVSRRTSKLTCGVHNKVNDNGTQTKEGD